MYSVDLKTIQVGELVNCNTYSVDLLAYKLLGL